MRSGGLLAALVLGAAGCVASPGMMPEGVAATHFECGRAAWYRHTSRTANGERGNPSGYTAAHKTLPFGTVVEVENLKNGKKVQVRINDRGPYGGGRIIDLTRAAATELGFIRAGTAKVRVTTAPPDPRRFQPMRTTMLRLPIIGFATRPRCS